MSPGAFAKLSVQQLGVTVAKPQITGIVNAITSESGCWPGLWTGGLQLRNYWTPDLERLPISPRFISSERLGEDSLARSTPTFLSRWSAEKVRDPLVSALAAFVSLVND